MSFLSLCRPGLVGSALRMVLVLGSIGNLFVADSWGAGPAGPVESPDRGGEVTLLAFGDSLTAGWGLPAGASVPALLQDMFVKDGYKVNIVNAGVSGDTTSGGLTRLSWSLADKPDAALVELGANDGLRGLDPKRVEANLDRILTMLKERDVKVLLTGMRVPPNMGAAYAEEFNAIYPRLAERHGVAFYPFYLEGVAGNPALNLPDSIHPNQQGAQIIARRIYPAVRGLVDSVLVARR